MSLHTPDPSAWFPEPLPSPRRHIFGPIGEFGIFGFFEDLLTVSRGFAVLLAPFQLLCMPVRVVDASAMFPKPSVSSLHQDFAPIGELGDFCLFGIVLITSGIFAVIFVSIRPLCTCVRPLDASARLPGFSGFSGHVFRLLAGTFDVLQPF